MAGSEILHFPDELTNHRFPRDRRERNVSVSEPSGGRLATCRDWTGFISAQSKHVGPRFLNLGLLRPGPHSTLGRFAQIQAHADDIVGLA